MSLKIGIVGAGVMLKYQANGFRSAGAEITCVADTNPVAAQKAATEWKIPRVFTSLEEMLTLASSDVDAVSILTPPAHHKTLTIQALRAGKHVFCEKPPAMNAYEAQEMFSASRASGRQLLFDFNNRARPESLEIIQRINSGFFGRINSAQAVWVRRSGIPGYGNWFTNQKIAGGGALMDLMHMLDLALYFMGYPKPKHVLGQTFNDFMDDPSRRGPYGVPNGDGVTDVESSAHATITFETGQVLTLHISWAEMVREEKCFVTLQGQKAGAMVSRLFQDNAGDTITGTCEVYSQEDGQPNNQNISVPFDNTMGRVAAAINFVRSLQGEDEPLTSPLEACRLMSIVDAIYLSAKTGQPVALD
ncbi:Gfo/Idh/MocA family oxidoreductase [Patescibacteria group bacterium]|nr:Gfo/Idh/MocA family oxidoreductase [Patescibacteria group bacterium]